MLLFLLSHIERGLIADKRLFGIMYNTFNKTRLSTGQLLIAE